jgi:hypothetical protein
VSHHEASIVMGLWPTRGCCAMEMDKNNVNNNMNLLQRTCKLMLINEARQCNQLRDGWSDFDLWDGEKNFPSSSMVSRLVLRSAQPSIRRILRTLSVISKGWNVKLTTHLHSVFRSNLRWFQTMFSRGGADAYGQGHSCICL